MVHISVINRQAIRLCWHVLCMLLSAIFFQSYYSYSISSVQHKACYPSDLLHPQQAPTVCEEFRIPPSHKDQLFRSRLNFTAMYTNAHIGRRITMYTGETVQQFLEQ